MRALLLVVLLLPVLAGCLGAAESEMRVTPFVPAASAAPGRVAGFVLLLQNTAEFRLDADVGFEGLPAGWTAAPETGRLSVPGGAVTTLLVNVTPAADARYGLHRFAVTVGDGRADLHVHVRDADGTPARAGVGARVLTAGLWENGTVFYTNWREIRDNDRVPRRALGDPATEPSYDPLKVYVGGRRGEPPPEPYNRSGYRPVIQGFDAALRGVAGGETVAVRIPPEFAYTQPRNEGHPLYGDALTFLVHVVGVDVLEPDSGARPGVPCPPPVCAAGHQTKTLFQ